MSTLPRSVIACNGCQAAATRKTWRKLRWLKIETKHPGKPWVIRYFCPDCPIPTASTSLDTVIQGLLP